MAELTQAVIQFLTKYSSGLKLVNDHELVVYESQLIKIICPLSHVFKTTLEKLKNDSLCPKCDKPEIVLGRLGKSMYSLDKVVHDLGFDFINIDYTPTEFLANYTGTHFELSYKCHACNGTFVSTSTKLTQAKISNAHSCEAVIKRETELLQRDHDEVINGPLELFKTSNTTYTRIYNLINMPVKLDKYSEFIYNEIEKICIERDGVCLNIHRYRNVQSPIIFHCNYCGQNWRPIYSNLRAKNSWCEHCADRKNISETKVRTIFTELFPGHKFYKARPDFLKYTSGHNLELDGYDKELKIAFEYNGIQHYKLVPHMHRPNNSNNISTNILTAIMENNHIDGLERDDFKRKKCKENGVRLIIISYEDMKNGDKFVKSKIHDSLKDVIEQPPSIEWAQSPVIVTRTKNSDLYMEKTLTFIEKYAPGYKFKDPNTVIANSNDYKFCLICPNKGHEWYTTYDNFVNARKGCKDCSPTLPRTLASLDDEIFEISRGVIHALNMRTDPKSGRSGVDGIITYSCKLCGRNDIESSHTNMKGHIKRDDGQKIEECKRYIDNDEIQPKDFKLTYGHNCRKGYILSGFISYNKLMSIEDDD